MSLYLQKRMMHEFNEIFYLDREKRGTEILTKKKKTTISQNYRFYLKNKSTLSNFFHLSIKKKKRTANFQNILIVFQKNSFVSLRLTMIETYCSRGAF